MGPMIRKQPLGFTSRLLFFVTRNLILLHVNNKNAYQYALCYSLFGKYNSNSINKQNSKILAGLSS